MEKLYVKLTVIRSQCRLIHLRRPNVMCLAQRRSILLGHRLLLRAKMVKLRGTECLIYQLMKFMVKYSIYEETINILTELQFKFLESDPHAVKSTNQYLTVENLKKYTNYSVTVVAFTKIGDGVKTKPFFCRTHEDGKKLKLFRMLEIIIFFCKILKYRQHPKILKLFQLRAQKLLYHGYLRKTETATL